VRRLLGVTVVALSLAGCVAVPTSGPVVEGRPAGDPVPPPNVAVLPAGPRPGDEPVAVVEGFLSSMASYEPGYTTAREFLTPDASAAWRPESGIAVYAAAEGARRVSQTDTGVRTVLAPVAQVGPDGAYTAVDPEADLVLDFEMERVDGEWRIASPPEGLVMTSFDFNREYDAFASYFFDPSFTVLVPDLTYLPVRGNVPTLLAEDLLGGPSRWLDPAVRSALGPGVALASGAVPVAGGTARVDLTDQVAAASAQQRDRLAAQLAWTLQQAPGVTDVEILANGQPLPLPSSDLGVVSAEAFAYLDPAAIPAGAQLFAVSDGAVITVGQEQARPVPGPLGAPGLFRSVGVNVTGTKAAAVSSDGTTLTWAGLAQDAATTAVVTGSDLGVPAVDRNERAWVVDREDATSQVLVVDGREPPAVVPAEGLEEVRVERLAVAPDGVRLAAVYVDGAERRLALALVVAQPDGSVAIGQVRDLAVEGVDPVDVAWASATALALLALEDGESQPYLVELSDGALSARGQVSDAVSLAAAPGQALVIGTGEGRLLRQDPLQEWVPVVDGTAPTYPG
jgi:hypothetical protein